MENLSERAVEQLITEDIETIAEHFQRVFNETVQNVRRPNVLVVGITGAGKSSLINAVFGGRLAQVGDGVPVTQHYTRFVLPDKPVIGMLYVKL